MNNNINEGFWDALITQVKRGALATAGTLGSKKADGKLSAENLSKDLYDAYQKFIGATGQEASGDSMEEFLTNVVKVNKDFSKSAGDEFHQFLIDPVTYFREYGSNKNTDQSSETDEVPKDEPPSTNEPKNPNTQSPASDITEEFKNGLYFEFCRQRAGENTSTGSKDHIWKHEPDGNFVFALPYQANKLKSHFSREHFPVNEIYKSLNDEDMLRDWHSIKLAAKKKFEDHSQEEMQFVHDALAEAAELYGKNIFHDIARMGLAIPVPGKKYVLKVVESKLLESAVSDGELRKFFLKTAQSMLRSGAGKAAAMSSVRGVPSSLRTTDQRNGANSNNQGKPQSSNVNGATSENPAQQATTSTSSSSGTTGNEARTVTVELSGVDLTSSEQKLLAQVENQTGDNGLSRMVHTKDPEVDALVKKILDGALTNYKKASRKK